MPLLETAAIVTSLADAVLIVGTSLQVYPAASLVAYAPSHAPIYYVDPKPSISYELGQRRNVTVLDEVASEGVWKVANLLRS